MTTDALGTAGGVVSAQDHRLAIGGSIAVQGPTELDVRLGVLDGIGASALLTGTSATGTMTVAVAPFHAVTARSNAGGAYLGPCQEAATTVNIAAAPGANSRIDVVYVKQSDADASVLTPDGSTAPILGVATGTAAASPTKPAIPVGALELGTVTVAAGATSTNGAGVTIANTVQLTATRGAPIPVRSQTDRDAITLRAGLQVKRLDASGRLETYSGTEWRSSDPIVISNMASRPTSGRYAGMRVWDTATAQIYTYDGTYWRNGSSDNLVPPGAAAGNYITGLHGFTSTTTNASGIVTVTHGKTFSAAPATVEATSAGGEVGNGTQVYPLSNTITTTAFNVGLRDFNGVSVVSVAVKFNWRIVGYNT